MTAADECGSGRSTPGISTARDSSRCGGRHCWRAPSCRAGPEGIDITRSLIASGPIATRVRPFQRTFVPCTRKPPGAGTHLTGARWAVGACAPMSVTEGQMEHEWQHLLRKLARESRRVRTLALRSQSRMPPDAAPAQRRWNLGSAHRRPMMKSLASSSCSRSLHPSQLHGPVRSTVALFASSRRHGNTGRSWTGWQAPADGSHRSGGAQAVGI